MSNSRLTRGGLLFSMSVDLYMVSEQARSLTFRSACLEAFEAPALKKLSGLVMCVSVFFSTAKSHILSSDT